DGDAPGGGPVVRLARFQSRDAESEWSDGECAGEVRDVVVGGVEPAGAGGVAGRDRSAGRGVEVAPSANTVTGGERDVGYGVALSEGSGECVPSIEGRIVDSVNGVLVVGRDGDRDPVDRETLRGAGAVIDKSRGGSELRENLVPGRLQRVDVLTDG